MPHGSSEVRRQRWKQAYELWKQGKSSREMAAGMGVSPDTARWYRQTLNDAKDPEAVLAYYTRETGKEKQGPPTVPTLESRLADERARQEKAFDRQLLRNLLQDRAHSDAIVEAIEKTISKLPDAEVPLLPAPRTDSRGQTALLLFSDLHVGNVVRKAETGGLGEYNYRVFQKRLNSLRDAVRSITMHHRQTHPVKKLVIAALGDNVEGETIFPSQRLGIDMDVLAQTFKAVEDISSFIVSMLDVFEEIEFCGVVGNHGRIGRKGETKTYVNWDSVVYRALALKFEGTAWERRIKFDLPESFFLEKDVEGHSFMFRHGDGVKAWAGIPWYGIQRSVSRWIALANARGKRFEYMCMGHFHQKMSVEIPAGEVFVNGSFVGTTEFSVEVMESIAAASQLLMFVHPKYGVAARYPILLDR